MSGDHNMYQKPHSYLDFECPRCGHCCTDDYERGFVDGMQRQMQSSVDRAINKQRWVGLTNEEHDNIKHDYHNMTWTLEMFARAVEQALKEKNGGQTNNPRRNDSVR